MGLFRIRGRKKRDKAAEHVEQQTVIATAEPEHLEQQTVIATAEPEHLEQQTVIATAEPEVTRREVSVEERPDPDQPGWGRAIGQAIGKAREERSSHG
jgi:hypothetical protein